MHPPTYSARALGVAAAERGMVTSVVTEPGEVAAALAEPCDLIAVSACWFSMTDDRYTPEQRADWAVGRDPDRERALVTAVEGGTPLVALHSAVICFDGWSPWTRWLGGGWDWAASWHPPPAELRVVPEPGSPLRFEPFAVVDEEYQGLALHPDAVVVGRSEAGHPLVWLRENGHRRAAVSVLGHDHRSLDRAEHLDLLTQLVGWATREVAHG